MKTTRIHKADTNTKGRMHQRWSNLDRGST